MLGPRFQYSLRAGGLLSFEERNAMNMSPFRYSLVPGAGSMPSHLWPSWASLAAEHSLAHLRSGNHCAQRLQFRLRAAKLGRLASTRCIFRKASLLVVLVASVGCCASVLFAETPRIWTDVTGKHTREAAIESIDGETAVLRSVDGKQMRISIQQLCPDDRIFLHEWQSKHQKSSDSPDANAVAAAAVEKSSADATTSPIENKSATAATSPPDESDTPTAATTLIDCGPDPVTAFALSCDGKLLATGYSDGIIRIWNTNTGQRLHVLRGHSDVVRVLVFSPTSSLLASATNDEPGIRLWHANEGKSGPDIKCSADRHRSIGSTNQIPIAISRNDTHVAFVEGNIVRVCDGTNGAFRYDTAPVAQKSPCGVCFVAEDATLAIIANDSGGNSGFSHVIGFWDKQSGKSIRSIAVHAWRLAVSPDGTKLLTMNQGNNFLWDCATGEKIAKLGSSGMCPQFSADSKYCSLVANKNSVFVVSPPEQYKPPLTLANGKPLWDDEDVSIYWVRWDEAGKFAAILCEIIGNIQGSRVRMNAMLLCDTTLSTCHGMFAVKGLDHVVQDTDEQSGYLCASGEAFIQRLSAETFFVGRCGMLIEQRAARLQEKALAKHREALAKQREADMQAAEARRIASEAAKQKKLASPSWRDSEPFDDVLQPFLAMTDGEMDGAVRQFVSAGTVELSRTLKSGDRFDRDEASAAVEQHRERLASRRFHFAREYEIDPKGELPGILMLGVTAPFRCTVDSSTLSQVTVSDTYREVWYLADGSVLRACHAANEVRERESRGQPLYLKERVTSSDLLVSIHMRDYEREKLKGIARFPKKHVMNVCVDNLRLERPLQAGAFRIEALRTANWDSASLRSDYATGLNGRPDAPNYVVITENTPTVVMADVACVELLYVDRSDREVVWSWQRQSQRDK